MSVSFPTVFQHQPYPDPITPLLFAPEGRFTGRAGVVGNASGGTAVVNAQSDRAGEFLYILDHLAAECSTGEGNDGLLTLRSFQGDHNTSLDAAYRLVGVFNTAHGRRYTMDESRPVNILIGVQKPEVADVNTLITFNWESNVNTLVYALTFSGRYYRRSLVQEPGFLRTVLG